MRDVAEQQKPSLGEGAWAALAQLQLQERRVRDRQQREKEHMRYRQCALLVQSQVSLAEVNVCLIPCRYVEALRAQMREKVKLWNIDLPPLCSCGADFWDSHPDTCANNCVFYKNHKGKKELLLSDRRHLGLIVQGEIKPG